MSSFNIWFSFLFSYSRLFYLPADTFEKNVVAFRAVFDASQKAHGCVGANRVIELHRVQVLDGNPSENGSFQFK